VDGVFDLLKEPRVEADLGNEAPTGQPIPKCGLKVEERIAREGAGVRPSLAAAAIRVVRNKSPLAIWERRE
jgi:hypothetical protein